MRSEAIGAGLLVLGATLGGCYSGITVNLEDTSEDAAESGSGNADEDAGGEDDSGGTVPEDPESLECEVFEVGPAPLRRLTRTEYDNTIFELLQDDSLPASGFVADEAVGGFEANSIASLSKSQLEDYMDAAETLANRAVEERWDAVVECDPADTACIHAFIEDFGLRAFRRPLTDAEVSNYVQLFDGTEGTSQEALSLVLHAFLVSPSFLYHVEEGASVDGALVTLSDYEVASRLSYFLWASMPDEELFELAGAGMLSDPEVREEQARRMLEDDRARDSIASFHQQWLETTGLEEKVKDETLFPQWGPELAEAMQAETVEFADEVIRRGDGRVETLLTANWSIVSPDLAALYGVAPADGGTGRVELDPAQRSGVLTQAAMLAKNSHAADNSWVFRGLFVRERLLCADFPPPPANVESNDTNDPDRMNDPECSGCHTLLDPVGQGFDLYSPIGVYRTTDESGASVSGEGAFLDLPDVGAFDGAVELGQKLAELPVVSDCVATQWFRYATRREEGERDVCNLEALQQRFRDSGGDVRELIVDLVRADSFQHRGVEE